MEMANSGLTEPQLSRSLPLERKLPLLILGVLAFVLALSLGISYYAVRRSAIISASERLVSLSHVLTTFVQQQLSARTTAMERAAGDSSIIRALRNPNQTPGPEVARALASLSQPRLEALTRTMIVTPGGRPIGDVRLEEPAETQQVRDDFQRRALATDQHIVGKLYSPNGQASYWESAPVRDGGAVIGYIIKERRFMNARVPGVRDLIGADIDVHIRDTADGVWAPLTGERGAVAPVVKRTVGDSLEYLDLGVRGEALASTTQIPGTSFAVTAVRPMSAILERPVATIRILSVISILLIVVGGLIAWSISRQLVRPLVELTHAAEAIAEGEYSKRVETNTGDEIGRLGAAFNQMATKVQDASDHSSRAVTQLTRTAETQQFLADASRILAMSLSDQMLLAELTRFCVPTIADYCSLHIADDDGTLKRVESAHYDPAKQDALRRLARHYVYSVDGPGEVPEVMRTQQPRMIAHLDLELVKNSADSAETVALLDEIRPRSYMCVPLIARGHPLGAISFTMSDSGRTFTPADLDLAMELARRTAVAIDNALIYRRSLALRLEAEAASTAKSDFLAKMSHEIRTPINAMMGYAELLEMGISGPVSGGQAKQLGRIRASGEHLTSLVNEILDLAKIEAGRMAVEPTNGVANDAVDAALALIRPQAAQKGVELIGRTDDEQRVEYMGDPQRVQQILANLLSNAVKFTASGGQVSIRCGVEKRRDGTGERRDAEWACIVVEDTGVGIAQQDIERVFDPFVQVDVGYTRSHGGTGLGLTISRGLAQMMGGEITVESTLGSGSRFSLWLPVAQFVHS
jgi:signal transduction histidine kinase